MANPHPTPRLENLRSPWQPGTSGNPAGYSQGRRISDAIEGLIDERGLQRRIRHDGHRHGPGQEALAQAEGDRPGNGHLFDLNKKPDLTWFKMIVQRIEPPAQQIDAVTRLRAILDDLERERDAQEEQDKAAESPEASQSDPCHVNEQAESAATLYQDVPAPRRQRPSRAQGRPGGSCRRRSCHDLGGGTTVQPAQRTDPAAVFSSCSIRPGMLSGSWRSLQREPGRCPGLDCCGPFRASPQATSEP